MMQTTFQTTFQTAGAALLLAYILGILCCYIYICIKEHSKTFVIKRFYSWLPQARDIYNQISLQFDKQFDDFKVLKMSIKKDKVHQAYVLKVKYKSLRGKRFSF